MFRVIALLLLMCSLLSWRLPALAEETFAAGPRVRYSVTEEKVRVVLEFPGWPWYEKQSTPGDLSFRLATPLGPTPAPIVLGDPVVSAITLTPDCVGHAVLHIALAQGCRTSSFVLPPDGEQPFRLVVDIFKPFDHEETRDLAAGIRYTRIERQSEFRAVTAHVLDIDLSVPGVHLGVVSAQGGRERVCAMAERTGAVCGVNGGYFLGSAHPVGLLKVHHAVLSLPLWGRTALAFPPSGAPVLVNPQGHWHVTFPDGSTREIPDSLDAARQTPPPATVVVNGNSFVQAPANPDGVTLLLREGKVAEISRPGRAVPLKPGEFALLLSGDEAHTLGATLTAGAAVSLAPVLTPELADYPDAIGAGPRLLRAGQVEITGSTEHFQPDVLFGRAARTGLGITAGGHVVVAVVEAPGFAGGGATLNELAELLQAHGAVDAVNLDGGGSSTLAIGATAANFPPGVWTRPVASGVMVYADKP